MDLFYADLHIHSRYSRATSKQLTVRRLAAWATVKGLDVLATGDFTHPGWMEELEEALEQEDSGLLRLRDPQGLEREIPWLEGAPLPARTRFILSTEISSIYKKGGKVRKIHNLVFFPSFQSARAFSLRLSQVGNLASDGRPILGLDSRDLLQMALDTSPRAFVIPAHVWTPWFSLFGSRSGFDHIEECFGDLSGEIFALETGLSSDPEMNWLWSQLDRFALVSSSDAHSGEKLAREASIFSGERTYDTILRSLRGQGLGQKFLGTVEFFPEEGKYHLDGHRKCNLVLDPAETRNMGNICPVCHTPLTLGVLHRVSLLADRDQPRQPPGAPGFTSLIPLPEILSEILGKGPRTKAVLSLYRQLFQALGPELRILQHCPLSDLATLSAPLAEGIGRMRLRDVYRQPGYDGAYGRISVFSPQEQRELRAGRPLTARARTGAGPADQPWRGRLQAGAAQQEHPDEPAADSPIQEQAIASGPEPVLVVAGPGTGKTRTLLGRVRRLLQEGVNPRRILILTFTRAAARELRQRLVDIFGQDQALPRADTLHAVAYERWTTTLRKAPVLLSEDDSKRVFAQANPDLSGRQLEAGWSRLSLARERLSVPEDLRQAERRYLQEKDHWNLADYTDLLEYWLEQIESGAFQPYTHVLVDEIQDLTRLQLRLIRRLLPDSGQGFFGIGDPRQSIYAFRGAVDGVEAELRSHWPDLRSLTLDENYRSTQSILDFSLALFPEQPGLAAVKAGGPGSIVLYQARSGEQEARWIGERIRQLLGGTSHLEADRGSGGGLGPGEIAVLVRVKALLPLLEKSLHRLGLPCTVPEQAPFWEEPRVQLILNTVARYLGIARDNGAQILDCPDRILARGPQGLEAFFQDVPPFDRIFWTSQPYQDLKRAFRDHGGWTDLISWTRLESDLALVRTRAQKIRLLTLHAAKGLEFDTVFLPALEEGILPFAGPGILSGRAAPEAEAPDPEEEKRLLYVGLTRARNALYLSHAERRTVYGRAHQLGPSRLLDLLPLEAASTIRPTAHTLKQEKQLRLL